MFYGPSGTGKTHAVEAVANELNGLLIHLSPAKLKGTHNMFIKQTNCICEKGPQQGMSVRGLADIHWFNCERFNIDREL